MDGNLLQKITGVKLMIFGVEMTLFGRFLLQSEVLALLGGGLVLAGMFVR